MTVTCTRDWLEDELRRAILTAYADDTVLFGRDACERSIMFRIGRDLAPVVEERWPRRLWVDCEYNRIADPVQARVAKRVRGLSTVPDEQRSVFPDFIVHDRTGSSQSGARKADSTDVGGAAGPLRSRTSAASAAARSPGPAGSPTVLRSLPTLSVCAVAER